MMFFQFTGVNGAECRSVKSTLRKTGIAIERTQCEVARCWRLERAWA